MQSPNHTPSPARRGAALLIVIGLLGLLLIAAVAFSVLMTVERNAAANYRHAVQARQMLYAGLAQAMAAIDASVGDDVYPLWTNGTRQVGSRTVMYREDVLASCDTAVSNPAALCTTKVLSREALAYIPRSLRQAVETATPECLAFKVGGDTIGRYAYVVANVSGLLDANVVGTTNRWCGTTPGEITLSNDCPFEVTNATQFCEDRDYDIRYETLEELGRLNAGIDGSKLSNFETFSYAPPERDPEGNPKVYLGYDPALGGTLTNQLRARHNAITNAFVKCGINRAMSDYSTQGAEWAYKALIDYVDTDSVPAGTNDTERLARPASEAVPQIQNVALVTRYARSYNAITSNYTHTVANQLRIRCARPYLSTNAPRFTIYAESWCSRSQRSAPSYTNWYGLLPAGAAGATNVASNTIAFAFNDTSILPPIQLTMPLPPQPPVISSDTNNPIVRFFVKTRIRILDTAGNIVDQVPAGTNTWIGNMSTTDKGEVTLYIDHTYGRSLANPDPIIGEESCAWAEAIDPAINWNGTSGNGQWIYSEDYTARGREFCLTNLNVIFSSLPPYTATNFFGLTTYGALDTYGAYNACRNNTCGGLFIDYLMTHREALDWWNANPLNSAQQIVPDGATLGASANYWDFSEAWKRHFVKNAPLNSIGELGFLSIGRWMTINLYPHAHGTNGLAFNLLPANKFHPVLDYFTLHTTNGISRGLVNANSRNGSVHAAIFNNMPLNDWRGTAAAIRLNRTHASGFGAWLSAQSGSITNLSALGNFWEGVSDLGQANGLPITASGRSPPVCMLSTQMNLSGSASFGEFEREAVIRNAAELYTTRQQIYTIIVRADAMTFEYGGGSELAGNRLNNGSILGSARAVFQVWRDPVPSTDPDTGDKYHRYFVRLCKILSL